MMNKETRRLSKIPDEVRGEIGSYFVDSPPIVDDDSRKLPKLDENTAEYIRTGLTVSSSPLLLIFYLFIQQSQYQFFLHFLKHMSFMCSLDGVILM